MNKEIKKPSKVVLQGASKEAPAQAKLRTGIKAGAWTWTWAWQH